jgi:serine-type D-Ala-D-Ala carboxypeptidase (penicillin-binding protein 5/6)
MSQAMRWTRNWPRRRSETKLSADPQLAATAAVVLDLASGQLIYSKNPDQRLMPASTTKIMTMIVALKSYDPDEIITISRGWQALGNVVSLQPDDRFRALDLIQAMIVKSGNDTAVSIADHFPTGYPGFVKAMNQQARSLGLKNTHFTNVSGFEDENHYSSAHDLARLAAYALTDDRVGPMVATKQGLIRTLDQSRSYRYENTNQLLGEVEGVIGFKTGWTPAAGECLVALVDRQHRLITVVLNSTDRFDDTKVLIDWAFASFTWE